MRGTRTRAALVAAALSALIAVGTAGTASAATAAPPVAATVAAPSAVRTAASTPYPGRTAAQIKALSVAAMKKATSVHVTAHLTGELDGRTATIDVNGVIGTSGSKVTMSITGMGSLTVLKVGSRVWISGNVAFWTASGAPAALAKKLAGHWVAVSRKNAAYTQVTTISGLGFWTTVVASFAPTERVDGQVVGRTPVVGLWGNGSILFVSATGKPYPVRVAQDASAGTIDFVDWNKKVSFKAPKKSQVIAY